MTVTPADTALHLQGLLDAEQRQGAERAERLLQGAHQARVVLLDAYGARRVWLFGSLVAGSPTASSDVDLAVEGLPGSAYFSALADLMHLFRGPVDLVRLEEAPESLRERVLAEGVEL